MFDDLVKDEIEKFEDRKRLLEQGLASQAKYLEQHKAAMQSTRDEIQAIEKNLHELRTTGKKCKC